VNEQISQISQVGMAHAGVIATLHGECFETAWDVKAIIEILAMAGAVALISTENAYPNGFALFTMAADEAEIIMIGVTRDARRGGYGGRLLQAAIESAKKCGAVKMFLEVAEDNTGARALYEKCGFTICGRRSGYYDSGASAGAGKSAGKIDALIYQFEIIAK